MDDIDYDKTQKKKGGRPPKRNSQIENNGDMQNASASESSETLNETVSENSELSGESPSENSEFPKVIFINNKSSTYYIIPQLNMQLRPGEMNASASVEKDQLNQILNNVESFNLINGWDGLNMGVTVNYAKEE